MSDADAGVNGKNPLERAFPAGDQTESNLLGKMGSGLAAAKGSSCDSILQEAYPKSPIYLGDISISAIKTTFQKCLDGTQSWAVDFIDANGTVGVNMDFSGAPHLGAAGEGAPDEQHPGTVGSTIVASGLGPNVNINGYLEDQPATPELPEGAAADRVVVDVFPNGHYGTLGSIESPAAASAKSSYTIGEAYVPGTSPHFYNSTPAEGDE
tara:strand:+ start:149 stop:778 length:630 start_codon:yes stop_codon:yes gene_type:complete